MIITGIRKYCTQILYIELLEGISPDASNIYISINVMTQVLMKRPVLLNISHYKVTLFCLYTVMYFWNHVHPLNGGSISQKPQNIIASNRPWIWIDFFATNLHSWHSSIWVFYFIKLRWIKPLSTFSIDISYFWIIASSSCQCIYLCDGTKNIFMWMHLLC